ncbi:MAG: cytochrome P450 [Minwuia sp.]|uniref:cytochrome P450 n=1 Tax=Minwuia sp. TaxID=2493630 RepID=UPI003A8844C0
MPFAAESVDFADPEVIALPQPVLDALRDRQPFHWNPSLKGWFATRFEDVRQVLGSPDFSVEKFGPALDRTSGEGRARLEALAKVLGDWIVFMDPPGHTRLRRAMRTGFMPRDMDALTPKVHARVDQLLAPLEGTSRVELKDAFANPLPAMVISDLFGIPEDDIPELKIWADQLGKFVLGGRQTPDRKRRAFEAVQDFTAYLDGLVESHRSNPRPDLTQHLIDHDEDGDRLSHEEIVHSILLCVWAGYETTANLIANGVMALARNPVQAEALARDPSGIPDAVEEFLRFEGAAQTLVRIAKTDTEVAGQPVAKNEKVFVSLFAANHDPDRFELPGRLDTMRQRNRHMGFGHGIHLCLGAPLARLEGRAAFEGLLKRFEGFRIVEEPAWRDELMTRTAAALHLEWRPRR